MKVWMDACVSVYLCMDYGRTFDPQGYGSAEKDALWAQTAPLTRRDLQRVSDPTNPTNLTNPTKISPAYPARPSPTRKQALASAGDPSFPSRRPPVVAILLPSLSRPTRFSFTHRRSRGREEQCVRA
jgi:hypothetical protein